MAKCFKCGVYVFFDNWHVSKNGRKIPLEPGSGPEGFRPHECHSSSHRSLGFHEFLSTPSAISAIRLSASDLAALVPSAISELGLSLRPLQHKSCNHSECQIQQVCNSGLILLCHDPKAS